MKLCYNGPNTNHNGVIADRFFSLVCDINLFSMIVHNHP